MAQVATRPVPILQFAEPAVLLQSMISALVAPEFALDNEVVIYRLLPFPSVIDHHSH